MQEFLSDQNNGLEVLVDYLTFRLMLMRWVAEEVDGAGGGCVAGTEGWRCYIRTEFE